MPENNPDLAVDITDDFTNLTQILVDFETYVQRNGNVMVRIVVDYTRLDMPRLLIVENPKASYSIMDEHDHQRRAAMIQEWFRQWQHSLIVDHTRFRLSTKSVEGRDNVVAVIEPLHRDSNKNHSWE